MPIGRRRYRRFAVEGATVEYRLAGLAGLLSPIAGVSPVINLGLGGVQFVTSYLFSAGTKIVAKLHFTDGFQSMTLKSRVVWQLKVAEQNSYRTGAEFLDVDGRTRRVLKAIEDKWWNIADEQKREIERRISTHYPIERSARVGSSVTSSPRTPAVDAAREQAAQESAETQPESVPREPREASEVFSPSDVRPPAEEPRLEPKRPEVHEQARAAAPAEPTTSPPEKARIPPSAEAPKPGVAGPEPGSLREVQPAEPPQSPVPPPRPVRIQSVVPIDIPKAQTGEALIPVYVVEEDKGIELNQYGEPTGRVLWQFTLPGIKGKYFACTAWDESMESRSGLSFEKGQILVFSLRDLVRTGDFALIHCQGRLFFRQVFFETSDLVRLRPLNPWYPENRFATASIRGSWRLVARIETFE